MVNKKCFIFLIFAVFLFNLKASDNESVHNDVLCVSSFMSIVDGENIKERNEISHYFASEYSERLKEMHLSPLLCSKNQFVVRIIVMFQSAKGITFSNTSIEMYKENESFFLRTYLPFPAPYSPKYDCYKNKKTPFLIYKMKEKESEIFLKELKATEILKISSIRYEIDEKFLKDKRKKPWAFWIEAVSDGEYHSAYSEFLLPDVDDAIILKDKTDSKLTSLGRKTFEFLYDKILKEDVRYFEFDKKWEDLKPFEGCKVKEEKKSETESEKATK